MLHARRGFFVSERLGPTTVGDRARGVPARVLGQLGRLTEKAGVERRIAEHLEARRSEIRRWRYDRRLDSRPSVTGTGLALPQPMVLFPARHAVASVSWPNEPPVKHRVRSSRMRDAPSADETHCATWGRP